MQLSQNDFGCMLYLSISVYILFQMKLLLSVNTEWSFVSAHLLGHFPPSILDIIILYHQQKS